MSDPRAANARNSKSKPNTRNDSPKAKKAQGVSFRQAYLRYVQGWNWTEEIGREVEASLDEDRVEAKKSVDPTAQRKAS